MKLKFKVGDLVKLKKGSRFYDPNDKSQVQGVGMVIAVHTTEDPENDDILRYTVMEGGGRTSNSYGDQDLELVKAKVVKGGEVEFGGDPV